ncbi:MAG TPA: hypothetical protein VFK04_03045 [Gemmatimonadaceae bacterium]|nr:hypothetical protein [Gemmatimonadaceae bacterium]
MPLKYDDLDPVTREFTLAEFDGDVERGTLTISSRIRPTRTQEYESLLREALAYYDDRWLEDRVEGMVVDFELRHTPSGATTTAKLPSYAPRVLAEGDFNRYYMRGVCARAVAEGRGVVEVYRARVSAEPRPESQELEGQRIDAATLLQELRTRYADSEEEPTIGKPNSGLSVRLV